MESHSYHLDGLACTKAPEKGFKALINKLCLAIQLRMISGTVSQLDISQIKERPPKNANEYPILVKYNGFEHAVQAIHMLHEDLNDGVGSKRVVKAQEVSILGQSVHDHQDAVGVA